MPFIMHLNWPPANEYLYLVRDNGSSLMQDSGRAFKSAVYSIHFHLLPYFWRFTNVEHLTVLRYYSIPIILMIKGVGGFK